MVVRGRKWEEEEEGWKCPPHVQIVYIPVVLHVTYAGPQTTQSFW